MVEGGPSQYTPRHDTRISLEQYQGVASDIIEVNEPVADGFMRVSDLRRDIVIVRQAEQRVLDYDQVGSVRIAKRLRLPYFKRDDSPSSINYDMDAWYVGIDDQRLAREASDESVENSRRFDEIFTSRFQKEVNSKIRQILMREKIIGQGFYPQATVMGYLPFAVGPAVFAKHLAENPSLMEQINQSPQTIAVMLTTFWTVNAIINVSRTLSHEFARMFNNLFMQPEPSYLNHPFVRRDIFESLLPSVPVDRIARGVLYLKMHGDHVIEIPQS